MQEVPTPDRGRRSGSSVPPLAPSGATRHLPHVASRHGGRKTRTSDGEF